MASANSSTPPSSPKDVEDSLDVTDEGRWNDNSVSRPHEGITTYDLLTGYERYGDPELEDGDEDKDEGDGEGEATVVANLLEVTSPLVREDDWASLKDRFDATVFQRAIANLDAGDSQPNLQAGQAAPAHQPTAPSFRSHIVMREDGEAVDVLDKIREHATRPLAFPDRIPFTVNWLELDGPQGKCEPLTGFWSFRSVTHRSPDQTDSEPTDVQADETIMKHLEKASTNGSRVCASINQHSLSTILRELHQLGRSVVVLMQKSLHPPPEAVIADYRALQQWSEDKMELVLSLMLVVIEAEKAYHGTISIPNTSEMGDILRICARYESVLDRNLNWHSQIGTTRPPTGFLIDCFADNQAHMQNLENLMVSDPSSSSIGGWRNYHDGWTEYTAAPNARTDIRDEVFLDELPTLCIDGPDGEKTINANWAAQQFTRKLIQHTIALIALLKSCEGRIPYAPPWNLHFQVEITEQHKNERSILISKAAWLIVAQAEQLWNVFMQHESKGHVSASWVQEHKAKLRRNLGWATSIATLAQLDTVREKLRHESEGDGTKYEW